MSTAPTRWGPDPTQPEIHVLVQSALPGGLDALLKGVAALQRTLEVPVQAVRAERVLGRSHLVMAAVHARRALESRRSRADDPAVEFLLYAAAHRQIHHALTIMGVPADDSDAYVVVLAPADGTMLRDAAKTAGLAYRPVDLRTAAEPLPPSAAATTYWRGRLAVADDASAMVVEEALLAAMAGLAVARA